jgi:hypothetical protein
MSWWIIFFDCRRRKFFCRLFALFALIRYNAALEFLLTTKADSYTWKHLKINISIGFPAENKIDLYVETQEPIAMKVL